MLRLGSCRAFEHKGKQVVMMQLMLDTGNDHDNRPGVLIQLLAGKQPMKYLDFIPLSPHAKKQLRAHKAHLIELPKNWQVTQACMDDKTGIIVVKCVQPTGISVSLVDLNKLLFDSIETSSPVRSVGVRDGRLCLVCRDQVMVLELHDRTAVMYRMTYIHQHITDGWKHCLWVDENAVLLSHPLTLTPEDGKSSALVARRQTDGIVVHWQPDGKCNGQYVTSDIAPSASYQDGMIVVQRFGVTMACMWKKILIPPDDFKSDLELISQSLRKRLAEYTFTGIDDVADISCISLDEWCVALVSCSDPTLAVRAIGVGCGMVYIIYSRDNRPLEMAFVTRDTSGGAPRFPAQILATSTGIPYYMVVNEKTVDIYFDGERVDRYHATM